MSAKAILKIVDLNFMPNQLELPIGSEVLIRVTSHSDTYLYTSSQRKFIVVSSEFETPELFPGDSFSWKFQSQGTFILSCPLYSWMKAKIIISASENPQDPDMFIPKTFSKTALKSVSTQKSGKIIKKKVKPPSIVSSLGSEDEVYEPDYEKSEGIDTEIENLFLRVKEECEKDQIKPANFLQEIEEDTAYETREKVSKVKDIVSVEREERKANVVFTTRVMAPSRYFPEYFPEPKPKNNKINAKKKKKEKDLRKRLRTDKKLCSSVLKNIVQLKINKEQLRVWEKKASKNETKVMMIERKKKELEKVINKQARSELETEFLGFKLKLSEDQNKKFEDFMNSTKISEEQLNEELYKRKIACQIFGFNHLWWAEKIFYPEEKTQVNYSSSLNIRKIEDFLTIRKFYIGWSGIN